MLNQLLLDTIDKIPSLPTIDGLFEAQVFIIELIFTVSYFLPMYALTQMFLTLLIFRNFEFIIKLILKIWDMLPFT